jgi:magnesium transporter
VIRTFVKGPGGLLRSLGDGDAATGAFRWIDVEAPSPEEIIALGREHRLERLDVEDVLEDTELPKHRRAGQYHFVITHAVIAIEGDRVTTSELDAFIGEDTLITVHRGPMDGLEWLVDEASRFPAAAEGGPDRMFARLVAVTARRYFPVVDELESRNLELEDPAVLGHPSVPEAAQVLRREAVTLRRALGPQADVVADLSRVESRLIGTDARNRLADTASELRRLVEAVDTERMLLGGVLDTYRSAVAERMNEVMKVLTVFSAILLPLSLMAGIYGMNFAHMPELAWRWGYFILLGIMAVTAVGLWGYFARRGFIGGPRLGSIPVGLVRGVAAGVKGIAVITTAPFRVLIEELSGVSEQSRGPDTMDDERGGET